MLKPAEQKSFTPHPPSPPSTKELTGLILLFSPSPSSSWIFEKSQKNLKSVCERRQRLSDYPPRIIDRHPPSISIPLPSPRRFTNSASPAEPANTPNSAIFPCTLKDVPHYSSSLQAAQGLLHGSLSPVLAAQQLADQGRKGRVGQHGGADSVPDSHKRGVPSSTSHRGYSTSALPRCRCSPRCSTLHTQTQRAPDTL